MEPEYNNNFPPIREQEKKGNALWYIILIVLLLILIGWYGYSAGWFSPRDNGNILLIDQNTGTQGQAGETAMAQVDTFDIFIAESFPVQVSVRVAGQLPNGCAVLETPSQVRDGNIFYINLETRSEGEVCTQALVPYDITVPLNVSNLPAGVYVVNVNGQEQTFELSSSSVVNFEAGSDK